MGYKNKSFVSLTLYLGCSSAPVLNVMFILGSSPSVGHAFLMTKGKEQESWWKFTTALRTSAQSWPVTSTHISLARGCHGNRQGYITLLQDKKGSKYLGTKKSTTVLSSTSLCPFRSLEGREQEWQGDLQCKFDTWGRRQGKENDWVGRALDCKAWKISARLMESLWAKASYRNRLILISPLCSVGG